MSSDAEMKTEVTETTPVPSSRSDSGPTVEEPATAVEGKPEAEKSAEKTKDEKEESGSKSDKPPLAQHDSSILDLAFAMDCTGSMGSYIHKAQTSIRHIVEEIVANEKSDIHLALVEYRDHPPQDRSFITKVLDFTPSVGKMKKKLDACSANGGGDGPEAVADALHQVSKLSWRSEATKICVFIADAPPHGMGANGDGFPNGCPLNLDPLEITGALAQKGITMYMVGCEPAIVPYRDFFMTIAHMTGGQYVPLTNAELLAKVIIGGAQEEITLERLMQNAQQEVEEEVQAMGGWGRYEECAEEISERVMTRMNRKGGFVTKQLQMNASSLPEASTKAKKWAGFKKMSDVRKDFGGEETSYAARPTSSRMSKKKSSGFMSRFRRGGGGGGGGGDDGRSSDMPEPYMAMASPPGASFEAAAAPAPMAYDVAERTEIDQGQAKRMLQRMMKQQAM